MIGLLVTHGTALPCLVSQSLPLQSAIPGVVVVPALQCSSGRAASKHHSMRVYLDINIGDAAKYEQELAAYNRATSFLQQCGPQYGLSANIADLDNEGKQMLREAYANDPNWSSKGDCECCVLTRVSCRLLACTVPAGTPTSTAVLACTEPTNRSPNHAC